jgi:ribosomal protein S1
MVVTQTGSDAALQPKAKLAGKIVKTTLAGALVDVGQALPGVLHISQLRTDPVKNVEEVVREGQDVDVWIRRVRKDRIELTMIEPLQLEWRDMQPDMIVKGKVVRLESYGAFVDIGAERPGMIHVSELAHTYVKEAKDVVAEGDEVEAKVLGVDVKKRQVRLSLKALQPEVASPEDAAAEPKRAKRGKKNRQPEKAPEIEEPAEPAEPQLTAMQIAWQTAQDRAKTKAHGGRAKPEKQHATEQEEILSRTLEKRMPTGA